MLPLLSAPTKTTHIHHYDADINCLVEIECVFIKTFFYDMNTFLRVFMELIVIHNYRLVELSIWMKNKWWENQDHYHIHASILLLIWNLVLTVLIYSQFNMAVTLIHVDYVISFHKFTGRNNPFICTHTHKPADTHKDSNNNKN